jgi:hypothetical protein
MKQSGSFEKNLRKRRSSVFVPQGLNVAFEIIIWIYTWECTKLGYSASKQKPL